MTEHLSEAVAAKKRYSPFIAHRRLKPKQIGAQINCAPWGVTTPDNRAGAPFSVA